MIRHSTPNDYSALYQLWNEAFGDDMNFIRFYFDRRHQDDQMLIYEYNGAIAGMLSLLPITISWENSNYPGRYIYAVATARRFRGKGIATSLINAAHDYIDKHDEWASILSPSSASLFDFYKKLGYEHLFSIHEKTVSSSEITTPSKKISLHVPSAEDIYHVRNHFFSNNIPFVRWSIDALKYAVDMFQTFEKGALFFEYNKAQGYALCGKNENEIYIYEMAHPCLTEADALSFIHQHLGASNYILRTAESESNTSSSKPFGMIHYSSSPEQSRGKNYPYLGIALD